MADLDFQKATALGRFSSSGYSILNKYGAAPDADTGVETLVWDYSATATDKTIITSAETMDVVSSSANDASGGSGMRTVIVSGIDSTGAAAEETVTLNGVTPVTTTTSWLYVHRAYGKTWGSTGLNAGAITIDGTTSGVVQAQILASEGQTLQADYKVPTASKLLLTGYFADVRQNIASVADIEVRHYDSTGGGFRTRHSRTVGHNKELTHKFEGGIVIPAGDIVRIYCTTNALNAAVSAGFSGIVMPSSAI